MRGSQRTIGLLCAGLLSCGSTTKVLPAAPQIVIHPDAQRFDSDLGFGHYIGTAAQQSFQITDEGQQTLVISSVTKNGDTHNVFTITGPNIPDSDGGLTVDGGIVESRQTTFIRVVFTPTQPMLYAAKLTINSNAGGAQLLADDGGVITPPNPASIDIPLGGLGILPPDGGPDGG
jgi:hypothetical protein